MNEKCQKCGDKGIIGTHLCDCRRGYIAKTQMWIIHRMDFLKEIGVISDGPYKIKNQSVIDQLIEEDFKPSREFTKFIARQHNWFPPDQEDMIIDLIYEDQGAIARMISNDGVN